MFEQLGMKIDRLYGPKGCGECNNTGYKGRMGVYELLVSSPEMKKLVIRREPVERLRSAAISEGMRTLLQDGIGKVIAYRPY